LEDKFPLKIGDFQGLCLFTKGYIHLSSIPNQIQDKATAAGREIGYKVAAHMIQKHDPISMYLGKTIVKSTFFHFNPLMFLIDLIALYENNMP
jgi:hypothetical protein